MSNHVQRVTDLPSLPERPEDSHKGMFGHVLVIAGSRGMAGAAGLVGMSALRSGAGLVRVACPAEVQPTVAGFEPSYMTYPLEGNAEGELADTPSNRDTLSRLAGAATVLAIGPGLGQGPEVASLVRWLLSEVTLPVVLDADGLNVVVGHLKTLTDRKAPLVLTPHPGECGRLLERPTADIQKDREASARALATQSGAVVVLKGFGSIVTDGRSLYVNTTGNPNMATGGTGDVLTGVIAGLLAQGLEPFAAAQIGTYVHGLAGDLNRENLGEIGQTARDLLASVPDAFHAMGTGGLLSDRDL